MIVCAAVKLHIDKTGEEVILCGVRHGHCFQQLPVLGFEPRKGYEEIEQGFVTHDNRFLNRKEALAHAVVCGQVSGNIAGEYYREEKKELFSEDLW